MCIAVSVATYQLVFLADNIWDVHVVSGWAKFFELLAGEDIDGNQMNLSVTVFASLGGGHVNDLARAVLDADETILSQGRALHGIRRRRTRICCGIEGMFMLETLKSATYFLCAQLWFGSLEHAPNLWWGDCAGCFGKIGVLT